MKKISFIIPVYNVEKYVAECIESIICEKYKNMEIIIVNDGSTDKSLEICQEYAKKDSRIIVVDKKNEGVSKARNVGIDISSGDYIIFVDSDDYYKKDFLQILLSYLKYDFLCFGYNKVFQNKVKKMVSDLDLNSLTDVEISILTNDYIGGFIGTKVFLSEIINTNKIRFDENIHYCEDLFFVIQYISFCKSFKYIKEDLYNYRMRKSSASFNFINVKSVSVLESYKRLILLYEENKYVVSNLKYKYLLNYYKLRKIIRKHKSVILGDIIINEKQVLKDNNLTKKEIISFFIIKNLNFLYIILKKIKDKMLNLYE